MHDEGGDERRTTGPLEERRDDRTGAEARIGDDGRQHRRALTGAGAVQLLEPGRPHAEHGAAHDAEQEPTEQQQGERVASEDHHHRRHPGQHQEGYAHPPSPEPIGDRPGDEKRAEDTDDVHGEDRHRRAVAERQAIAIQDEKRGRHVGAVRHEEQSDGNQHDVAIHRGSVGHRHSLVAGCRCCCWRPRQDSNLRRTV